jgi:RimJ/RimL family protein N-acetyltransferase
MVMTGERAPAGGTLTFRPVTAADLPMLRDWLGRPHWRDWWGEPEEELGHIRAMVEGRDSTRPFIIELDGAPAGYIQVWIVGDQRDAATLAEHPWLAALPGDAVGVDLSLADGARLSRGIGSAALRAFARRLRAEGRRTIVIDPDRANTRAVRAYGKAGFRPVPALEGRTGDVLIMQYHSSEDGTP